VGVHANEGSKRHVTNVNHEKKKNRKKEGCRRFAKREYRQKAKDILWTADDIFIYVVRLPIVKMSSPHGDS